MGELWGSILGALVPEPERTAVARRWGGNAPLVSFLLGSFEFVAGVKWIYESAMGYLAPLADQLATAYLEEANKRTVGSDETLGFTWGGAMLWAFWLLRPTTWILISIPIVGLLRVVTYLGTQQAVAEPSVWALVRLAALGRRRAEAARERAEFGPATEPDEVEADAAEDLLVFTPRPRHTWNELVTIEVAGNHYRVTGQDYVVRAGRRRHRYRLHPAGEHDVIRRFEIYELPKTGIRWAAAKKSVEGNGPNENAVDHSPRPPTLP